jgi:DNA-binding NtrC family response regulator
MEVCKRAKKSALAFWHSEGHQLEAARLIRINPSTLNAKIKHYGIQVNTFSKDVVSNVEEVDSK